MSETKNNLKQPTFKNQVSVLNNNSSGFSGGIHCFFSKSLEMKLAFVVKSEDVNKNLVYILSEIREKKMPFANIWIILCQRWSVVWQNIQVVVKFKIFLFIAKEKKDETGISFETNMSIKSKSI